MSHFFSLPQCAGYLAFALGVLAFLQKSDRRLKLYNVAQSAAYAVHFVLLGNIPGGASAGLSGVRSTLAVKSNSPWLAALMVVLNLVLGVFLVERPWHWIPIFGSCLGTVAMFLMSGIPMRLTLFAATICWLTNNILSGSIGGTALEFMIGVTNLWTISRLFAARRAAIQSGETDGVQGN